MKETMTVKRVVYHKLFLQSGEAPIGRGKE